jgi:hypothetical protein
MAGLSQALGTPGGGGIAPADSVAKEKLHINRGFGFSIDIEANSGAVISRPVAAKPHMRQTSCAFMLEEHYLAVRVKQLFLTGGPEGFVDGGGQGALPFSQRAS